MSYYNNAVQRANLIQTAINYLPDEEAETVTALFPDWEDGKAYAVGDRVKYNGLLYRCVQAHTSQADWTPDVVPANEKHWTSDIDANVYEPGVYGWAEQ